jgi:PqqD family protein of HPr-rel-A system
MSSERLRPSDTVVWQDVPDAELVLLHPESGKYYGLNAVGGRVWRALDARPRTVDELVDDLVAAFPVDRDRAVADVDRLLAALRAADLVTAVPVAATTAPVG